jgi:hypothetical protein
LRLGKFAVRLGALALMLATAGRATAGPFEEPPSSSPDTALGQASKGSNYVVLSPVSSDGMLRRYTIRTQWGDFETTGDQLMAVRVRELNALHALDETNAPKSFGQAAVKAGLGPVMFAGSLIANPVDTTQNTVAGIGQVVGGISSGLNNMGKSRDSPIASLTGEAKQKRLIATELGVDPYTDFKPLADRVNELAGSAAAGNLAVSGAFMAVPGAAGIVVANTSTVGTLRGMINDYSSAQLMDMNRDKLARLGVAGATANSLLANPNYTPVDVTAMVEALSSIGAVGNLSASVEQAAAANGRSTAYFVRRRIELTAAWQRSHQSIVAFVGADNIWFPPDCKRRDRRGLSDRHPVVDAGDRADRRGDDGGGPAERREDEDPDHHRNGDAAGAAQRCGAWLESAGARDAVSPALTRGASR